MVCLISQGHCPGKGYKIKMASEPGGGLHSPVYRTWWGDPGRTNEVYNSNPFSASEKIPAMSFGGNSLFITNRLKASQDFKNIFCRQPFHYENGLMENDRPSAKSYQTTVVYSNIRQFSL
jgi:hypothetical protein